MAMSNYVLRSPLIRWFAHRTIAFDFTKATVTAIHPHNTILACPSLQSNSLHLRQLWGAATQNLPHLPQQKLDNTFLQCTPLSWSVIRTYAKKGKDKGGKGGKGHKKMVLTADQLEGLVDMDKVQGEMDHIMEDLKEKFIHQVNVRTSQGVFDNLIIKTPDGNFPLIQLGQVIQKSSQLIVLNMAAAPQYIGNVKEALAASGLNINPQQDGTSLFLPLPKVTREHRETLAKNAKMLSEKSKKHLRDIFSRYSKKIKSSKEGHSSDDIKAAIDMVEDLMHNKMHQVEAMTALKQKELLGSKS